MERTPPIAVVGLGNVLMSDDALGPWVVQVLLAGYDFPEAVSVLDLGTPGLDLMPFVAGREALILVDTVKSSGAPGTLRTYRKDEILRHPPQPRLSPHDPGVKEALLTADFGGVGPREVLLVGVVPGQTTMGTSLTPAVREAVPRAVEEVLAELGRLGAPARPRAAPGEPDVWWERGAPSALAAPEPCPGSFTRPHGLPSE
jgi:hydrogenase maturation protease